jgi:hypothetical protein
MTQQLIGIKKSLKHKYRDGKPYSLNLPIQRIPTSEDFVKVVDTKDIQPSLMKRDPSRW